MDFFDTHAHLTNEPASAHHNCAQDISDMLTVAKISQGIDPLQAALDAQLQAPLIEPFLF
jgi:hypothetical protein